MPEKRPRLRYWILGKTWAEGWFLLSLLAGLFLGFPGLAAAVSSYFGVRAASARLPRHFAAIAGLGLGILAFFLATALLTHLHAPN